ncbi:MAG: pyruvate kinase, partial [Candidatus Methylumidiphilus sp.]
MFISHSDALLNSTVFINNPALEMRYRQTKIIFTIGPATAGDEVLKQLINEQVDICRLNMAHGNHDWTRATIRQIKRVCQEVGRHIGILMDIKGPEIRTGDVGEPIYLENGQLFDFWMDRQAMMGDGDGIRGVEVNYPDLVNDVAVGDRVLVDSGLIHMEVVATLPDRMRCRVVIPGTLGNRRHINLPGVR